MENETEEKHFLIPASLLQAVIDYMAQQPWKDVAVAMPKLLNLKPEKPQDKE